MSTPPPPESPPPPPPGYPPPEGQLTASGLAAQTSGKAAVVLVLGVVGLVLSCGFGIGLVAAVVALALAPGAKREIAASGGALTGSGLLQAGVILSWVAVALSVAFILYVVLAVVAHSALP